MNSLRRWLYRPKRSDPSLLAQFYFADEELNLIAAELDGFEGRKDPERCAALVNQLRACQARVLNIVSQIMDESIKDQRALRDFRVKFPDDVIQENLAGQLWFGAECLAAGSSIMNREVESACMRPLARALTKNLDSLRTILREQCLHNVDDYSESIKENLIIFDKLFAEFELSYVSAMVSVKTAHEYDMIQEITVLFSETVQRALRVGLLTQDMIDEYDPALMFTIPRLAIICGVLIFKDGPLNPDNDPWNISEMFRPFQTLLLKIRELLSILAPQELTTLERALCSQDEPSFLLSLEEKKKQAREERRKYKKERKESVKSKTSQEPSDGDNGSIDSELTAKEIAERLEALASNFEATHDKTENKDPNNRSVCQTESGSGLTNGEVLLSSSSPTCDNVPAMGQNGLIVHQADGDLASVEDPYQEVNHGHSEIVSVSGSDLLIQGKQMPSHLPDNDDHSVIDDEDRSLTHIDTSVNHDELLNDGEQFSLNKCESRDSGLQSEVISNSGSMFTISSSDSNQQILSSDSIPAPSEPNSTDSCEDADSNDLPTDNFGEPFTQLENSSDSSATIVSSKGSVVTGNEEFKALGQESTAETGRVDEEMLENSDMRQDLPELGTVELPCSTISNSSMAVNNSSDAEVLINIANCDCDNVENVSDTEQVSSVKTSDTSAKPALENANHSDITYCDNTNSNRESEGTDLPKTDVNANCDRMPCDSVQTSSPVECHSDSPTEANSVRDSVVSNTHKLTLYEDTDSDLCSKDDAVGSAQQNPSGHSSHSLNNIVITEQNGSSQTQLMEVPPISEAIPSEDGTTNSEVNVKTDLQKGASNMKHKVTSKKNGKTHGRKTRRQDSGSSRSRDSKTMLCPHHARLSLDSRQQLDSDRYNSSDTSSYTSECGDEEEIALAIEAAESATRNQVRARFRSSSDMIHRLFVCISGVADQLQTNFAGDLRNILRCVFDMNCPDPMDNCENEKSKDTTPLGAAYRAMSHASRTPRHRHSSLRRDPPTWLPDEQSNECMACQVPFNFLRRRHHCRNCGKIFCSRCSSTFVPLPHFGQDNAVRVCNRCFMFQVTPFTTE